MIADWHRHVLDEWEKLPQLAAEDIFLFAVPLSDFFERRGDMFALLSADEQRRADDYRFEEHRDLFILRRGVTRQILGRYSDQAPENVSIKALRQHKPQTPEAGLQFSMSGSADFFVLAVSRDQQIGVDIEHISDHPALELVVEENFTDQEQAWLKTAMTSQWHEHFFQIWTRKEAVLKAIGKGLSWPMAEIDVLDPQNCLFVEKKEHEPLTQKPWTCTSLNAPEEEIIGYIAHQTEKPNFLPFLLQR